MVRLETERADERTGTTRLHFRVTLVVSWTPTADTFISIAFLTSTDYSTMVIIGTLLNITLFSNQIIRFQVDIERGSPGAIMVSED